MCCNVSILRLFGIRRLAAVGRSPHTRLFHCHVTGSFSTQQQTASASDTMRLESDALMAGCAVLTGHFKPALCAYPWDLAPVSRSPASLSFLPDAPCMFCSPIFVSMWIYLSRSLTPLSHSTSDDSFAPHWWFQNRMTTLSPILV